MRPPASSSNLRGIRGALASFAAPLAVAAAAGAAFWVPAVRATRGYFPAPLDDVYIHFDFARSLAEGHPFEWIPGNGYSSGETSPLYAALLGVGWALGLRGRLIGVWAAILAIAGVASFVRSLRILVRPCPPVVAWGAACLALTAGVLDWTLFSGMEIAAFAGLLGPALLALARTRAPHDERGGLTREAAQLRLGAWCAALVLLRPEAVVLAAVFAIAAARGVGRRSAVAAMVRVAGPGALATALVLGANLVATGAAQSAGAQLKLISSLPYLSSTERARFYVENLVVFALKGVRSELASLPVLGLALPALALASLGPRGRRPIGAACLAGALGWVLLAAWNSNSPHHNFRYFAPALLLVFAAAGEGAAAIATALGGAGGGSRGRLRGAAAASLLLLAAGAGAVVRLPAQVSHFRRASANIRDQQIEVAARVAALGPGARVLLNDAGAIPFVSRAAAIDALGLGGYRRLPFAEAAPHGEAATLELIERLTPADRPTHLALYPHWFGITSSRFGTEIDRVTITDNVICAGPTKVLYRADWSPLEGPRLAPRGDVIDEIDVADIVSEKAHRYQAPLPEAHAISDIFVDQRGERRFDGGRVIPEGKTESFVVNNAGGGRGRIVVRVDAGAGLIRMRTKTGEVDLEMTPLSPDAPGDRGDPGAPRWREATAPIDALATLDEIELTAARGAYRDYHVWIVRP